MAIIVDKPNGTAYPSARLQVLEAASGALPWELDLDYPPAEYAGPKIYVQAGTIENSVVAGYNVSTGKKLWQSPSLGAVV